MGRLIRSVLMPLTVIVLGAVWVNLSIAYAVQENCGQDCVTDGQVTTWRWVFLTALGLWTAILIAHLWRRRHGPMRTKDGAQKREWADIIGVLLVALVPLALVTIVVVAVIRLS